MTAVAAAISGSVAAGAVRRGAAASAAVAALTLAGLTAIAASAADDGAVVFERGVSAVDRHAARAAVTAGVRVFAGGIAAVTALAANDLAAVSDSDGQIGGLDADAADATVAGGIGLGVRAIAAVTADDGAAAGHGGEDVAVNARAAVAAVKGICRAGVGGCAVRAVAALDRRAAAHGDGCVFGVIVGENARRAVGICGAAVAALDGAVGDGEVGAGMLRLTAVMGELQAVARLENNGLAAEIQRYAPPGVGDEHGAVNVRTLVQLDLVAVRVARAGVHRDRYIEISGRFGLDSAGGCGRLIIAVLKRIGDVLGVHQHGFRGHAVCVGVVFDVVPGVLRFNIITV